MPWEFIIVPIIAVAVWIIGTLLRGAEQPPARNGAPPRKGERVTDLDRFLREVHRRRQGAEGAEGPARAERRREPVPRAAEPAPRQQAIPVALPVDEVVVVPEPAPALRTIEAPPLPQVPSDRSARSRPPRPESAALGGLLRSRDGLRTAVVLQEVLGPPLSRRRRL
jgi:hypothetical protein